MSNEDKENNKTKNIVLLSDGTGNTSVKGRGTNVFKIYEAIDIQNHKYDPELKRQIAFYDDGVGTSGIFTKIMGALFGWGFSKNVCKLYLELVRVYELGDKIFYSDSAGAPLQCGHWQDSLDIAGF